MSDSKSEQQEPSMEDILSSIRRIISEDGDEKPSEEAEGGEAVSEADAVPVTEEVEAVEEAEPVEEIDDVFDLTDMVDEEGKVVELSDEGAPDLTEADEADIDTLLSGTGVDEDAEDTESAVDAGELLMSEGAEVEAAAALSTLAQATSPGPVDSSALKVMKSGLTIEQYVLEMLRPMLREWLDENLPTMVQRLVEREIERLARRADPVD